MDGTQLYKLTPKRTARRIVLTVRLSDCLSVCQVIHVKLELTSEHLHIVELLCITTYIPLYPPRRSTSESHHMYSPKFQLHA